MPSIDTDLKEHLPNIVPLPKTDIEKFSHGTEVASLAIGGPIFARINANFDTSRFKLNIRRIYVIKRQVFNVNEDDKKLKMVGKRLDFDNDSMKNMVEIAKSFSGIVNLSFKSRKEILHLTDEDIDTSKDNTLFVVAAGNHDGEIIHTGEEGIYPAVYGGEKRENVIAVAALKHNGQLATFSNFGGKFVDIGAPGCDIAALSSNEKGDHFFIRRVNGTSVAAPLVTFASALVKSELGGKVSARQIKRRILVSADIVPELDPTKVSDRRRLNIVHAASVFDDILVRGEPAQSHWGTAKFVIEPSGRILHKDDDIKFCEGVKPKVKRVLKIVPQFKDVLGKKGFQTEVIGTLIYHYSGAKGAKVIEKDLCKNISTKIAIRFDSTFPQKDEDRFTDVRL